MKTLGQISYINIQGWMMYDLHLSGNELLLYALIYGYTQDGKNQFHGSLSYIENGLRLSRPTVISLLQNLQKKSLILKTKESFYIASKETLLPTSKETLPLASKETLPNIYNTNNNTNNNTEENISEKSKTVNLVNDKKKQVNISDSKQLIDIVNDYEETGTFTLQDFSPANVLEEYTEHSLRRLAEIFLSYYVENKKKISKGNINAKMRFNKFVISDYHKVLVKKPKWSGLYNVTDEEFMSLMGMGYLKSSQCKFYNDIIKPELDTDEKKEIFSAMVRFYTNKNIEAYKNITFKEFAKQKGYNFN